MIGITTVNKEYVEVLTNKNNLFRINRITHNGRNEIVILDFSDIGIEDSGYTLRFGNFEISNKCVFEPEKC